MTLVNAETGEVIAACTPDEARELTERIRDAADSLFRLLAEAHDREAWRALGYSTFKEYFATEFGMTKQRAYQLLDQARIVAALEAESTIVDSVPLPTNEAQTRALAPVKSEPKKMAQAMHRAADATNGTPTAAAITEAVTEILNEEQAKAEQRATDKEAIEAFNREHQPEGFDPEENRRLLQERGAFARLCKDLVKLGPASEFIAEQGEELRDRHIDYAEAAYGWLDDFLLTIREGR